MNSRLEVLARIREWGVLKFVLSTVLMCKRIQKNKLFDFLDHEDVDDKHHRKVVKFLPNYRTFSDLIRTLFTVSEG